MHWYAMRSHASARACVCVCVFCACVCVCVCEMYLGRAPLQPLDDLFNLWDEKRPRVEQVDFVHHDDDDAEPAPEAAGLGIQDVERVAQNVALMVVPEKYGTFSPWAHLTKRKKAKETKVFFVFQNLTSGERLETSSFSPHN